MTRRLEEVTEDALLLGGRAGQRAVEEAGFSSELKERLYNKVAEAQFEAIQKAQETGKFINMDSNYRESQPDIRVQIDRQRAADLGVSVEDIGRTLELMFGETEVSTFVSRGDEYPVIMRARAQDRATPNDLTNTFIRASNGELVPLSAVAGITRVPGPLSINQLGLLPAVTISFDLAPGVALGQAVNRIAAIKDSLSAIANLTPEQQTVVRQAFAEGYDRQNIFLTAMTALGLIASCFLWERKPRRAA